LKSLLQLDADEILATRENLDCARPITGGPPARCVPENLCTEISILLELIELEIRDQDKKRSEN